MSGRLSNAHKGPRPGRCCGTMALLAVLATALWFVASDAHGGHDAMRRAAIGTAYALLAAGVGVLTGRWWAGLHLHWYPAPTKARSGRG